MCSQEFGDVNRVEVLEIYAVEHGPGQQTHLTNPDDDVAANHPGRRIHGTSQQRCRIDDSRP